MSVCQLETSTGKGPLMVFVHLFHYLDFHLGNTAASNTKIKCGLMPCLHKVWSCRRQLLGLYLWALHENWHLQLLVQINPIMPNENQLWLIHLETLNQVSILDFIPFILKYKLRVYSQSAIHFRHWRICFAIFAVYTGIQTLSYAVSLSRRAFVRNVL